MRNHLPSAILVASFLLLSMGVSRTVPWLVVVPGVVVGTLVLWPIAVAYANTAWPLTVSQLEVLPAEVATRPVSDDWGRATVARLSVHGFVPRSRYRVRGSQLVDFGQCLHNDLTGEVASLTAVQAPPGGEAPGGLRTVHLYTRFTDGGILTTTNSPVRSVTPEPPGDVVYRLPEVTDVDQLYAVHRRLMKADGRRIKPIVLRDDPLAWEREGNDRSIAILVARGLAVRDETAGVLCPTLKGAIRAAWRLHPWTAGFRRRRNAARARAALAAALARHATPSAASLALRSR